MKKRLPVWTLLLAAPIVAGQPVTTRYEYDESGRLQSMTTIADAVLVTDYVYDDAGNLVTTREGERPEEIFADGFERG